MYSHKHGRSGAREQARDVLMRTIQAKQPNLREHSSQVAQLAMAVARRFGMAGEEIDEIARAAELHDVGKVGIPDAVLDKPGGAGRRPSGSSCTSTRSSASASSTPRPRCARWRGIVRSTHERWDGTGYPDGLRGADIPPAPASSRSATPTRR